MKKEAVSCKGKLAYLSLQATREGQASYAHVHEIIRGLEKRGWQVRLYEPSYAASSLTPGLLRRAWEFTAVQLRLFASMKSMKPDILYVRHHFASFPAVFLARLQGIPIALEVNGPYEDLFIAWPFTKRLAKLFVYMMRSQLRWADLVVAVTPQLAEWARSEGAKRVVVIPNGANTEKFRPEAKLSGSINLPSKYVIFFGALAPWQGIDTILAAVENPRWPRDVKLVIVGDGIERKKVEAVASRTDRVRYLGLQPYDRMPGIVAGSLVALSLQSDRESRSSRGGLFPLKVFEALASGVPVIVSDFPGMADLVRNCGCGLVVPPEDPHSLAEAVNYLYRNSSVREAMGRRGRELISREHSWDKRAEQTHFALLSLKRARKG